MKNDLEREMIMTIEDSGMRKTTSREKNGNRRRHIEIRPPSRNRFVVSGLVVFSLIQR